MPVSDLCNKKIVCIERGASLEEAAKVMKKHGLGALVVVEGDNVPVGVLTDRDIVLCLAEEDTPLDSAVGEAMSDQLVTASENVGIAEAVDKMKDEEVRRLVIIDDDGKACGLISSDDVLQLMARELSSIGQVIQRQTGRGISKPSAGIHKMPQSTQMMF